MNATRAAFALLVGVTAARLLLIGTAGLGDTEAYYWTWSQFGEWSYYDHPPGVAWMIRATTALFGDGSFGVRVGPVLLGAGTAFFVWLLTWELFGRRAALFALGALFVTPMFYVGAVAAVPDAPLGFFWSLFLYGLWRALDRGSSLWATALGLVLGIGFLAKYFMLLLAPMVLLMTLAQPQWRSWWRRPEPYSAAALAAIGAAPVILWNLQNGFISASYHLSERHRGYLPRPENIGRLLGGQLGYVTPILLLGLLWAGYEAWKRREDLRWYFVAATSLPVLGFFYLATIFSREAEPHWPAMGYLPLMVGLGALLDESWQQLRIRVLSWAAAGVVVVVLGGLHLHLATPIFLKVIPEEGYRPKYDLANELHGWPQVRAHIEKLRQRIGADDPVVAYHYTMCSQLGHALRDPKQMRCVNTRNDAFDYLRPAPGTSLGELPIGANALYVGDNRYKRDPKEIYRCFLWEEQEPLLIHRGGRVVRHFRFDRCVGYEGQIEEIRGL